MPEGWVVLVDHCKCCEKVCPDHCITLTYDPDSEPCQGAFYGSWDGWTATPYYPDGCDPSPDSVGPFDLSSGEYRWTECCPVSYVVVSDPYGQQYYLQDTSVDYGGCYYLDTPDVMVTFMVDYRITGDCLDSIAAASVSVPGSGFMASLSYQLSDIRVTGYVTIPSSSIGRLDWGFFHCQGGTVTAEGYMYLYDGNGHSISGFPVTFTKLNSQSSPSVMYDASGQHDSGLVEWTECCRLDENASTLCFPNDPDFGTGLTVDGTQIGECRSIGCYADTPEVSCDSVSISSDYSYYSYSCDRVEIDDVNHVVNVYIKGECSKDKVSITILAGAGQSASGKVITVLEGYPGQPVSAPSIPGVLCWSSDPDCSSVGCCDGFLGIFPYSSISLYAVFEGPKYWVYCYWPSDGCGNSDRLGRVIPYDEGDTVQTLPGPSPMCPPDCKVPGGYRETVPTTMPPNDLEFHYEWADDTSTYTLTILASPGIFSDGSTTKTFRGRCGTAITPPDNPWLGSQHGSFGEYGPNRFSTYVDSNGVSTGIPSRLTRNMFLYAKYSPISVDAGTVSTNAAFETGVTLYGSLRNTIGGISVMPGAVVVIRGLTINGGAVLKSGSPVAGLSLDCDSVLIVEGSNTIRGFALLGAFNVAYPSIYIPEGCTATITGSGSLTVSGIGGEPYGGGGNLVIDGSVTIDSRPYRDSIDTTYGSRNAAIGCCECGSFGDILIKGGNITCLGGDCSAGIGSSCSTLRYSSECGSIEILGGTVTASGGPSYNNQRSFGAAGIGTGSSQFQNSRVNSCGDISIYGGSVTAVGGQDGGPGIGAGDAGVCGDVTIGNSVVYVTAEAANSYSDCIGVFHGSSDARPGTVGTVTIGGVVGTIPYDRSPYTYYGGQ